VTAAIDQQMTAAPPGSAFTRADVTFLSGNARCHAWHYRPNRGQTHPLLVMAHGFAAEKTFQLPYFAEHFANAGIGVLLFDYRHFGESEGQPRNHINASLQRGDWQAALNAARTLPGVAKDRIGLWSTSFGAGHALITAAKNPDLAALIMMVPIVDVPRSMAGKRLRYLLFALLHGLWDLALCVTGCGRHYIPVVSEPSSFAAMNQPGCYVGYHSLLPPDHTWDNRCHASVLLEHALYRPTIYAPQVKCPTLVVNAHFDQLIPRPSLSKMTAKLPKGRLVDSWTDHFGVYTGKFAQEAANIQLRFLIEHLRPQSPAAVDSATCSAA
jgi:uncharacterized protein